MDNENTLTYFQTMINSSTRNPKYMIISTVKAAGILGIQPSDVEKQLLGFVNEGKLLKSKLQVPPHEDIYMLP
jgi:hypothetical protein